MFSPSDVCRAALEFTKFFGQAAVTDGSGAQRCLDSVAKRHARQFLWNMRGGPIGVALESYFGLRRSAPLGSANVDSPGAQWVHRGQQIQRINKLFRCLVSSCLQGSIEGFVRTYVALQSNHRAPFSSARVRELLSKLGCVILYRNWAH